MIPPDTLHRFAQGEEPLHIAMTSLHPLHQANGTAVVMAYNAVMAEIRACVALALTRKKPGPKPIYSSPAEANRLRQQRWRDKRKAKTAVGTP
jgi:hypothetical protein